MCEDDAAAWLDDKALLCVEGARRGDPEALCLEDWALLCEEDAWRGDNEASYLDDALLVWRARVVAMRKL